MGILGIIALRAAFAVPDDSTSLESLQIERVAVTSTITDVSISSPDGSPDQPAPSSTTASSTTAPLPPTTSTPEPPWLENGTTTGVVTVADTETSSILASGIVLDDLVLTSAHAVGDAKSVTLIIDDRSIEATVEGVDVFNDLAVIRPSDTDGLPEAVFAGDAASDATKGRTTEPGATVWMVTGTASVGSVAVRGDLFAAGEQVITAEGRTVFDAFKTSIRTTALSPGSALYDDSGIAIAMVIAGDSYLVNAVPIDIVRSAARSIRDTGWPHRGWVGLEGRNTDAGVVVAQLAEDGPAYRAGLEVGDRVLTLDGVEVRQIADLVRVVRAGEPGRIIEVIVDRDDATVTVAMAVGSRDDT